MQLFNHGPNTRLVLAVSPSKPISKVQNGISCSRCYWIPVGLPLPLPWWGFCGFLGFPGTTSSLITVARHGSFMEAADLFDHSFFGISAQQVATVERGDLGRTTALAELTCHSEIRKKGKLIQQTQATRGLFARIISGCNLHHLFAEHTGRGPPNLIVDNYFCY